jgi:hypothetical protein
MMKMFCSGFHWQWLLQLAVEVIQGTGFDEAWLYERTDSDYRIVTKSGSNHIIPASNVKQIKGLAEIVQ